MPSPNLQRLRYPCKFGCVVAIGIALLIVLATPGRAEPEARLEMRIDGAQVVLARPRTWNGDLVLLVHGSLPDYFGSLVPDFLAAGFGVAYANLPEGIGEAAALRHTAQDSRIAEGAFREHLGEPARVYLIGFSRGSHAVQELLEIEPSRYAGVVSFCGGNGGSQLQWDHFFTARVLFDHYFPGALPGTALRMDPLDLETFKTRVVPQLRAVMMADRASTLELGSVSQLALVWRDFDELVDGIIDALTVHSVSVNDLITVAGGNPFDNAASRYSGTSDDVMLNAGVRRLSADARAREFLQRWYEPTGRIGTTPVLLVHTRTDSVVPRIANNDKYAALVEEQGAAEFLARSVIDRAGHCNFTDDEIHDHVSALVRWVKTGQRPDQKASRGYSEGERQV